MAEPNTVIASTGAALVTIATVAMGQLLGEYSIVVAAGLMGTLIALSEQHFKSFKESLLFIFKGVAFSFIFTGIITTLVLRYLPAGTGLTPYALLGAVAFLIGWTSNKWEKIKNWAVDRLTKQKKSED